MFTKEDIVDQLKAMGVPQDAVVLIHSSLHSVGAVEGRGEGLLDCFVDYFKDGLLCIPTHTWANYGKDCITLDMIAADTCIGTFPDIAAKDHRAYRSEHPTHSMAVFGDRERALSFIADEPAFNTPANPDGCYGKIYKQGGYIMLVGVGHNRNTYLHCVEEMLNVPNRIAKTPLPLTVRYNSGDVAVRYSSGHEAVGIGDVSAHYPKLEAAFRYHGAIVDGMIGNARTQLCNAKMMKEVFELVYKRADGRELFADDEPLDESLYK